MFLIFSKEKIYTYMVSMFTVIFLFGMAIDFSKGKKETTFTSSNIDKLLPIYKVETENKKIAITMNCRSNDNDIDKILEVLKENNVKMTFFITGNWADKYPECVKKIYNFGHEIGALSNTYAHLKNLSYEENKKELEISCNKIQELIGKRPILYRVPYGEYNNDVIKCVKDSNCSCIQWSIDLLDYTDIKFKDIDNKLISGEIVLMHDGNKNTVDLLQNLIKKIKKRGYSIDIISNLIYKDSYDIDDLGIQKKKK